MEKEIKLPSGNAVTFKDIDTLKVKDRSAILLNMGEGKNEIAQGLKMIDALLALLIKEWSFDLILPSVKIESLGELSIPDYDKLSIEAQEARNKLFPNLEDDKGKDSPKGK